MSHGVEKNDGIYQRHDDNFHVTLKFVIILQNLIKAYHRKSGKSKYDRKLTELDVETTRIRSRVNGAQ